MSDTMYLAHYGVMGMKWGVRKRPASSGNRVKTAAPRGTPSDRFSNASDTVRKKAGKKASGKSAGDRISDNWPKLTPSQRKHAVRTAVSIGAAVAGAVLASGVSSVALAAVDPAIQAMSSAAIAKSVALIGAESVDIGRYASGLASGIKASIRDTASDTVSKGMAKVAAPKDNDKRKG